MGSRLNETKEKINQLEDKELELTQSQQQKEKGQRQLK